MFDRPERRVAVRIMVVFALVLAVATGPAGAQDDGGAESGIELEIAALRAIVFDPWTIQESEIPGRRLPIVAYESHTNAAAAETEIARVRAEEELVALELVRDAAFDHRADMEEEVEGFSILMWELGNLDRKSVV